MGKERPTFRLHKPKNLHRMPGYERQLARRRERVIAALIVAKSVPSAAVILRIAPDTLYAWLKADPKIRESVERHVSLPPTRGRHGKHATDGAVPRSSRKRDLRRIDGTPIDLDDKTVPPVRDYVPLSVAGREAKRTMGRTDGPAVEELRSRRVPEIEGVVLVPGHADASVIYTASPDARTRVCRLVEWTDDAATVVVDGLGETVEFEMLEWLDEGEARAVWRAAKREPSSGGVDNV